MINICFPTWLTTGSVERRPFDANAMKRCLEDGVLLGVYHPAQLVARARGHTLASTAHTVAVSEARWSAIVAGRENALVLDKWRAHLIAQAGGALGHCCGDYMVRERQNLLQSNASQTVEACSLDRLLAFVLVISVIADLSLGATDHRSISAYDVITEIKAGKPVSFESFTIEGDLDLSRMTFSGAVHFNDTTFQDDVNFRNVVFNNNVYFENANFNVSDFTFADFNGNARFSNAVFMGDAKFLNSGFYSDAIFKNAGFKGDVNFWHAFFKGKANFQDAGFNGYAEFWHAEFKSDAIFKDARFKDSVTINDVRFNGTANFEDAVFNGAAQFSDACFYSDAKFLNSVFKRDTSFKGAGFKGAAYFGNASFNGTVGFSGSAFNSTDFQEAQFAKEADFQDAFFTGPANFDSIRFKGDALFQNATFQKELSLTRARYDKLYFRWDSLKGILVYDDAAYMSLMKNFKDLGYYEDYDSCYYQYRRAHRDQPWPAVGGFEQFVRKTFIDYPLEWFYGYGTKPFNAALFSLLIILVFALFWWDMGLGGSKDKTRESFKDDEDWLDGGVTDIMTFSATVFLSGTKLFIDPPPLPRIEGKSRSMIKKAFILERVLGALFSVLFFIAISGTIARAS